MNLVFFLEEPSAKELLKGLIPQLVPDGIYATYIVFQGKQDLEKNLVKRLSGWRLPNSRFVVLRDQDAGDCRQVRATLVSLVAQTEQEALIRVACKELEAWVIGDLEAVAQAYEQPKLSKLKNKSKFRTPDILTQPIKELQRHLPEYQKIDGARRVGALLDENRSNSESFIAFCQGIRRITKNTVSEADSHGD